MQCSTPWPVPGALLWVVCAPSLSVAKAFTCRSPGLTGQEDEPGILRTMAGDRSLWYRNKVSDLPAPLPAAQVIPFRAH